MQIIEGGGVSRMKTKNSCKNSKKDNQASEKIKIIFYRRKLQIQLSDETILSESQLPQFFNKFAFKMAKLCFKECGLKELELDLGLIDHPDDLMIDTMKVKTGCKYTRTYQQYRRDIICSPSFAIVYDILKYCIKGITEDVNQFILSRRSHR